MITLDKNQTEQLSKWMDEQEQKVIEQQKGTALEHENEAYYGAIGGGYTYHITPTGLGTIIKVSNAWTKDEIDLTAYDTW